MGRLLVGAIRVMARCLPLTPMARDSRTCIALRLALVLFLTLPIARVLFRSEDWFYRAIDFLGRHLMAAALASARCSPLTPMVQVLRTCILLRQNLVPLL